MVEPDRSRGELAVNSQLLVSARNAAEQLLLRLEGDLVHKELGSDGRIYLNAKDHQGRTFSVSFPVEFIEEVPPAEVSTQEIRRRMIEIPDRVVARHRL
jgi:hypothetical protein